MRSMTDRWVSDARAALPGADRAALTAVGDDLVARWTEPHRRYHDLTHLQEVLRAVGTLGPAVGAAGDERSVAVLAAWFHDAVYRTREPEYNERDSAALAVEQLTDLGADPGLVDRVGQAVLDTREHEVGEDDSPARVVLHDADLWVLAAPTDRFDAYCTQVRDEYAHVSGPAYVRGRTAVLRGFLQRPHVYASSHARTRWEASARENLAREISRLAA